MGAGVCTKAMSEQGRDGRDCGNAGIRTGTSRRRRVRQAGSCVVLAVATLSGCSGITPSARLQQRIDLPVPTSASDPRPERLTRTPSGESRTLTARSLIPIAFNFQPDIKSSYQRFKSEEARYDFFYVSRDSLTPQIRTSNSFTESRRLADLGESQIASRNRGHAVEFALEKRFFDTTELDLSVGVQSNDVDHVHGTRPFVSARLRYPLWASREKLERTSEDIFRRNELDDAQLAYIQQARLRLQDVLFKFYLVVEQKRNLTTLRDWLLDLEELKRRLDSIEGRDMTSDLRRMTSDLTQVTSDIRNLTGRHDIDVERLKAAAGLPFALHVEFDDKGFNPFGGATHEELLRASMETDPEIATLRNALRNAEVQLDLARRGRWDIALTLSGTSRLEGSGTDEGVSNWSVTAGLGVSAVDTRVTDSLTHQAQANIARFKQAITARENVIFVDTLEPVIRIDTLGASKEALTDNLRRLAEDYETGISEYLAGTLNIDDLLKRRDDFADGEFEIARLGFLVGANVAELCSATGKFFELLGEPGEPAP